MLKLINIFCFRCIATLLFLLLPAVVQAQFTFITNDDSITITGYTGTGLGGTVVIPATTNGYPVTSIGDGTNGEGAFQNSGVTNVIIPGSVTSIGASAFDGCSFLISVSIPNNVTSIGVEAFAYCRKLTTVTVPSSATNIDVEAFFNCGITNVIIPGGVTTIEASAFTDCPHLTSVTISPGVISIGSSAFAACSFLSNVIIPNTVTSIGANAFVMDSSLTNVTIPNSVTNIGDYAFDSVNLKTAYFQGNAPPDDGTVFFQAPAIVYYLPGTTGWGTTFGDVPAVLWNPEATALATADNQFGFNITGPTNATIVVEACTNLANPVWVPLSTNTLSGSGTSSFSDTQSANYPNRYYLFSAP
jgi:hypothetical protein